MDYEVRPYKWEDQLAAFLLDLKDGDTVTVPDKFIAESVRQAMGRWGVEADVKIYPGVMTGNCARCGGQTTGRFCLSCEQGQLHAQDCPQLWAGNDDPYFVAKTQEGPCNCGGDALYAAGRDGENEVRVP